MGNLKIASEITKVAREIMLWEFEKYMNRAGFELDKYSSAKWLTYVKRTDDAVYEAKVIMTDDYENPLRVQLRMIPAEGRAVTIKKKGDDYDVILDAIAKWYKKYSGERFASRELTAANFHVDVTYKQTGRDKGVGTYRILAYDGMDIGKDLAGRMDRIKDFCYKNQGLDFESFKVGRWSIPKGHPLQVDVWFEGVDDQILLEVKWLKVM